MTEATLKDRLLTLLRSTPGLTDREITDHLFGPNVGQQSINQAARALAVAGQIVRRARHDGKIGNYLAVLQDLEGGEPPLAAESAPPEAMSEDEVKRKVQAWLEASGWRVSVSWGREHGIDIEAKRNGQRWIIEAKGCGSLDPMRVNYFLSMFRSRNQRATVLFC